MLEYRRTTKAPMQTGAFRCIPMRLVRDNDENLVIDIARRTQTLLEVSEKLWLIINDGSTSSSEKFGGISEVVRQAKGMGPAWGHGTAVHGWRRCNGGKPRRER